MQSNQPTPLPKFRIGQQVLHTSNKNVYEIQSLYLHASLTWKYNLLRYLPHGPGEPCPIDTLDNVSEDFIVPSTEETPTPKPKFNVGDKVMYHANVWTVVEINKKYSPHATTYEYVLTPVTLEKIGDANTRRIADEKYLLMYVPIVPNTGHFDDVEGKWVDEPNPFEGRTVVNEKGGSQSFLSARFDCIPPVVLRLLAQCLGFGARKYGDTNYQNISLQDHLNHAMNHINEWNCGDRSEPHLVNAMARITFALWHAVEQKQQPDTYIHPDEKHS